MNIGPRTIATAGRPIHVSADGAPQWKSGGVTIDWSKVTAASAQTTLDDDTVIEIGDKYLPFGTILAAVAIGEVQTIDLSGGDDPTGGTFTITYDGKTTAALAYNASADDVEAALLALDSLNVGDVSVSKSNFVYTLTFRPELGNVAEVTADGSSLTSGGTATISIATGTAGSGGDYYGPADEDATDGRQTLTRGRTFIVNQTIVNRNAEHDYSVAGVIEGGRVYVPRLQAGKSVVGAKQHNLSDVLSAMGLLVPLYD